LRKGPLAGTAPPRERERQKARRLSLKITACNANEGHIDSRVAKLCFPIGRIILPLTPSHASIYRFWPTYAFNRGQLMVQATRISGTNIRTPG
jgi:hypothetical protein